MKKIILLLLAVSLYSFAFSAQKSEIQLNLTNGNSYKLLQKTTQVLTQTVMGNDMAIRSEVSELYVFHVLEATDHDYLFEVTPTQLKVRIITPMSVISFDSEHPTTNDDISKVLSQVIGKSFQSRVSKSGQVTEIKGADEIINGILNGTTGLDDQTKDQIKQQLSQFNGADAVKGNMETFFSFLPPKSVKPGDNWKTESSLAEFPISIKNTWTLQSEDASSVAISGKSSIESKGETTKIMGFEAKVSVSGDKTSSFTLNNKTGWIREAKSNLLLSGKVIIPKNEQVAEDMEVPVSLKDDVTISAVE